MRRSRALVVLALAGSLAHAEGVESRQKLDDTPDRLYGVTTMLPLAGGGLITLGGSNLRVFLPGARSFQSLHRVEKDNLYRVASNESGGVLAAWEKDPSIHYFTLSPKRHVTVAKPSAPAPDISSFHVEYLAFMPNGRDALVQMEGRKGLWSWTSVTFRVPLDASSPPELLYRVDGGRKLHITRDLALFLIPRNPNQACDNRTCDPVAAIVAYELTDEGVSTKTLLDGDETPVSNARMVWGAGEDQPVVLELDRVRNQRALLRWRPGDAKPELRPFARATSWSEELYATRTGDVLSLTQEKGGLVIRRSAPDGQERTTTLPLPPDPSMLAIHDVGERSDGRLWVHWGDWLIFFSADLTKPPRAHSIEPLLARKTEWAGVDVYVAKPEVLWVGLDGRGRGFARVSFAEMERRGKPWPPK